VDTPSAPSLGSPHLLLGVLLLVLSIILLGTAIDLLFAQPGWGFLLLFSFIFLFVFGIFFVRDRPDEPLQPPEQVQSGPLNEPVARGLSTPSTAPLASPTVAGPVVINVPPTKVLMKCSHCGTIYDLTLGRCDRCGAPAT